MINTLGNLRSIFLLLFVLTVGVWAQAPEQIDPQKNNPECLKVSLSVNSKKLDKIQPISLLIRVNNDCDEQILIFGPNFYLDRTKVNEVYEDFRWGDRKVGEILREVPEFGGNTYHSGNTYKGIGPGQYIEFRTKLSDIGWNDALSSLYGFIDIFEDLDVGKYDLFLYIPIQVLGNQKFAEHKKKRREVVSNKIEVEFDGKRKK